MTTNKKFRMIAYVCVLVLLCQGVCGCTKQTKNNINMEWIYDVDGSGYSIGKWREEYYLVIDRPSQYTTSEQIFSVKFTSVQEMRDGLIDGTLTEEQKLQCVQLSGTDNRLKIMDPDKIYDAVLPQDTKVSSVEMKGSVYEIYLTFTRSIANFASISYLDEDSYREIFVNEYRNAFGVNNSDVRRTETLGEGGKRVLYDTYSCRLRYTVQRVEETVIVEKQYLPKTDGTLNEATEIPTCVRMYCVQGDIYYIVELTQFTEVPTDEWLLQIGLEKYAK